jgi:hypothetical protein
MKLTSLFALATALLATPATAQDGLLFRVSADKDLTADKASGDPVPNFRSAVTVTPDGAIGGAARWADEGYVAWKAAGNMIAQRGTLAFFWRAREPVTEAPFVIFRAGFADHTSWDMAFLRIDWNGHGFDAFVTDANLSRLRVSWRMPASPSPEQWQHIAFAWDETVGVRLFVDGKEVAKLEQKADLDSGLDQFGMAGRVISPHQVQSRYSFMRGSDLDEIRVYDRMLRSADVAALAGKAEPALAPVDTAAQRSAWLHRYGWDKSTPPILVAPVTSVRRIEFADARDLKQWMYKGVDGIAETTWPGVYNRSKLPGRDDYFELPDWNVYVEGGKRYDLTVPEGQRFNRVEVRGAAYGKLLWNDTAIATRAKGVVRSVDTVAPKTGGVLSFVNVMQEQPIQEIWAYDVGAATEPKGRFKLSYTVDAGASPKLASLDPLNAYIAGRYPADERATVLAMPSAGMKVAVGAGAAGASSAIRREAGKPIVHVLIPASFGDAYPDRPLARAWDYGWQNVHDGLDGVAIDLPALKGKAGAVIPLNIRIADPIWPARAMIDLSVSVRAGEARTLWLDLRDRILPNDGLFLTVASAATDFDAQSLNGAKIRLVFKPRDQAKAEHVADRFNQVRDNWGFLVEEHTASKREGLYQRLFADISDLLRVDPDHVQGRAYWADINYRPENMPAVALPPVPAGVPVWAARQLDDLKITRDFVMWWIDKRQVPYGDFGGGISDDTDLTQQWPGLALMGVDRDKVNASLRAVSDAVFRNGMRVNGLGAITTDELHAYEEGLNSDAQRLYLNWGEPKAIERIMETTRALQGVILKNPAGHMHFATNWYGGRKAYRGGAFAWQKPYSFTVLHGPILLGLYNGNAAARGMVTGVIDGWMAHGTQGPDGTWSYPNEINWDTDATRVGDGGGISTPLQGAWASWRFTGDARYLRPIQSRLGKTGTALAEFNENAFDLMPGGSALRDRIAKSAASDPFARYAAWAATGDTANLAALHGDAWTDKAQHQYMYTEGHWWSDRVDQPNEILQRERLGGIALRRNQTWPGNTVSWRFATPGAAEQVAILMPGATRETFKVVAYNTSDVAQHATMSTWNVTAGNWRVQTSTSPDEGKTLVPTGTATTVPLERSRATEVTFAPHTTTVIEATLIQPVTPVEQRPDIGIGADDVAVKGRGVTLTVHGLGSVASGPGIATLITRDGRVVASTTLPAIDTPTDLKPRTAMVRMTIPNGVDAKTLTARVTLAEVPEVTQLNNAVALSR